MQHGYSLFSKGDIPGLLKLMSPKVTWDALAGNAPFAGLHQGPEVVGRFFNTLTETVDYLKHEAREFIAPSGGPSRMPP